MVWSPQALKRKCTSGFLFCWFFYCEFAVSAFVGDFVQVAWLFLFPGHQEDPPGHLKGNE